MKKRNLIGIGISILGFGVYYAQKSPFVGFHDSLSYLWQAMVGFSVDTNATHHFLYLNFLHLVFLLCPSQNPVFLFTLFSVISGAFTLFFVFQSAFLICKDVFSSILGTLTFAFSFTWWQQCGTIEVYAFNGLLFSIFVFLVIKQIQSQTERKLIYVSLIFGLLLLTHIQNILAIPSLVFLLFRRHPNFKSGFLLFGPALFISSLLIIFPIVFNTHSISAIFFDSQFGSKFFSFSVLGVLKGLGLAFAFLAYNFHFFIFFSIRGFRELFSSEKFLFLYFITLVLPWLLFGIQFSVPDNHVFFIPVWLTFSIFIAIGYSTFKETDLFKTTSRKIAAAFCMIALSIIFYFSVTWVAIQLDFPNNYHVEKGYKGGIYHLFWPGHQHAKNPLEMVFMIENSPESRDSIEWNIEMAQRIVHGQTE